MPQMKIVISLNSEKSSVGISKPDCDPVFSTVEGGLDAVIARLPDLVRVAEEKFTAAPKNPASKLPAPEPAPAHTGAARSPSSTSKSKDASRPSLF